jgi:predicted O-methyltransferase YrrM
VSRSTLPMSPALLDYVRAHSIAEPAPLARLREKTAAHPRANMQIAAEQGQFMRLLIGLIGARRTIELGTFTGYSAACTALALPADGEVIACDVSREYTDIGRPFWAELGVDGKIDLRIGPAIETLDALIAEGQRDRFDFAFVDADKTSMRAYFERLVTLVRPGGLIAFDNTLWSGKVVDPAVQDEDTAAIRALNDALAIDERVEVCLLPLADGLTLARRIR